MHYLGDRKLSSELGRRLRESPSLSSSRKERKSTDSTSLLAGEGSNELQLLPLVVDWLRRALAFFDGRPDKMYNKVQISSITSRSDNVCQPLPAASR